MDIIKINKFHTWPVCHPTFLVNKSDDSTLILLVSKICIPVAKDSLRAIISILKFLENLPIYNL